MRVRFVIISILLIAGAYSARAQFKYGIKGGINSGTVSPASATFLVETTDADQGEPDQYIIEYKTGSLGFHIGGVAQYYLGDFFIEPQLLFSHVKNDIQITHSVWQENEGGFGKWNNTENPGGQKFNKIDLPIMLGYRVGPLRILAGPMASMMISTTFGEELDALRLNQKFNGTTLGYQAGLGLELSSLNIDVKYEGALGAFGSGLDVKEHSFEMDQSMSQFILSVSFVLGNN